MLLDAVEPEKNERYTAPHLPQFTRITLFGFSRLHRSSDISWFAPRGHRHKATLYQPECHHMASHARSLLIFCRSACNRAQP